MASGNAEGTHDKSKADDPLKKSARSQRTNTGSVLTAKDIEERLDQNELFLSGTWTRENVRAAAYDLRMACNMIIVPDQDQPSGYRRYSRSEQRQAKVILEPGDVAFLTTMEHIAMPWDVAGNLGLKFSLASQGILMLTGLFVDPGYGLQDSDGDWSPANDVRLHFLLANVGPKPVELRPGQERIAAIQFIHVAEPESKQRFRQLHGAESESQFFDETTTPGAGLNFFTQLAGVRGDVINHKEEMEKERAKLEARVLQAEGKVDIFTTKVTGLESGTNQVVMFGIYVLSATVLGVSVATIFQAASRFDSGGGWASAMVWSTVVLTVGLIARKFLQLLTPLTDGLIGRTDHTRD